MKYRFVFAFLLFGLQMLCFSIQLGITVDETMISLNNKETSCLTVKLSFPRSPAYHLKKDDVLLSMELIKTESVYSFESINNDQVYSGLTVSDVLRIRSQATLEDSISVVLLRNGKLKQMIFPLDPAPLQEPFITLNTDMHASEIRDIAIHEGKNILVSVSYDKTLKIWDANTLSLLHTFRFPVEPGNSGKLYSVAISPDGNEVACSAYGGNWEKSDVIYIVDVQQLVIKSVIRGLENIATHLSYSSDSNYLLVSIRNHCEFAIYDMHDYSRLLAFYGSYKGASFSGFSPDGQSIISVGNDSVLRSFDFEGGEITLRAEKTYNNVNAKPFRATYSPDGEKIAVGFLNVEHVEILKAQTLELLERPVVFEEKDHEAWIHTLSWSPDSQTLYGGVYSQRPALITWKDGQMKHSKRIFLKSSPLDLATKGGRVYYCTEYQTIGFYEAASETLVTHESDFLNFSDAYLDFYCSADGSLIKIPFSIEGEPVFFDMALPGLTDEIREAATMIHPITYSDEMTIKNWRNAAETVLNGKRLGMKKGELSRALSINPLNGHFSVGTDWHIYHFDQNGDLIWSVPVNSTICALNTVKEGELIIAALSNGTFEWYESGNGTKLASLLITRESEWLFWTPDNDYIASSETIDWFGWQQNRDQNTSARFIPKESASQKAPLKAIPDSFFGQGKTERKTVENEPKRNDLYILSCAVEDYQNEQFEDLTFAIDDAKAITKLFQKTDTLGVDDVFVYKLYGDAFNRENLRSAFYDLKKEMSHKDHLILFFAGHGMYKAQDGIERFYFNYPGKNTEGLSLKELNNHLYRLPNQYTLVISDSCYSGALTDYYASHFIKNDFDTPEDTKTIAIIASAQAWSKSPEIEKMGHGIFTYHLLHLISTRERVHLQSLFTKLATEIKRSSEQYNVETTLPSFFIQDFNFFNEKK